VLSLVATLALAAVPSRAGDFQRLDLSERMAMIPRRERVAEQPARSPVLEMSLLELPLDADLYTAELRPIEPLPLLDSARLRALGAPDRRGGIEAPAPARFGSLERLLSFFRRQRNFTGFDTQTSED